MDCLNLFELFTLGDLVKFKTYEDEIGLIAEHLLTVGTIVGFVNDFYQVDFNGIIEIVDRFKLEGIL